MELKTKNRHATVKSIVESEGLKLTNKGSKDLAGGRRLHVLAAIAYKKGVILAVPYENMKGTFFAQFIRTHFNIAFGRNKTDEGFL